MLNDIILIMIRILYQTDDILFNMILFVIVAVAVLFSLILHEVAHGLVAHWCGDDTAKRNGRLTLNPVRHFDPIGAIMILFIGFGYAKPVPVNSLNFRNYKRGCILVSVAGIATNIVIALFAGCFFGLFITLYANSGSIALMFIATFFQYLSIFNCYLCFFNLLPLFPLDGYNLINSLCKRENGFLRAMRLYGRYILLALILVSIMVDNLNVPFYFSPLDVYLTYTADYVSGAFMKLGTIIFGGI